MKFMRYLLPVIAFCGMSGLYAAEPSSSDNERETEAVEDYIESKRSIFIKDKGGNLSLSGDVRFEYQTKYEKHNGQRLRGKNTDYGHNNFDVDVDLFLDYLADCTWGSIWLEFDNKAGPGNHNYNESVFSGNCDSICLRAAYMGYNVYDACGRFDVEIGRRPMYHVFDSRIQFDSRFDGVVFRFSRSIDCVGDFYSNSGIFVINHNRDDFGFVSEFGLLNIKDSGFDLKYSYIDWLAGAGGGKDKESIYRRAIESRNSQFTAIYHLDSSCLPECIGEKEVRVYGAFLYNHAARKRVETNNKKKNIGWYTGLRIGSIKKACDWSFDLMYQYVQAQAVIDSDVSGIKTGNVYKITFPEDNRRGNANFHGGLIEAQYAITDNLTVQVEFEFSKEEDKKVGGSHRYRKGEIEFIYGF